MVKKRVPYKRVKPILDKLTSDEVDSIGYAMPTGLEGIKERRRVWDNYIDICVKLKLEYEEARDLFLHMNPDF